MKLGVESKTNFDSQWKMGEQLLQGFSDILKSSSLKRKKHSGLTYTNSKSTSFLGLFASLLKAVLGGFSSMVGTLLKHVDNKDIQDNVKQFEKIEKTANQPNSSLWDVLGAALSGPESYMPGVNIHKAATDSNYCKEIISSMSNPTCATKYKPGKKSA